MFQSGLIGNNNNNTNISPFNQSNNPFLNNNQQNNGIFLNNNINNNNNNQGVILFGNNNQHNPNININQNNLFMNANNNNNNNQGNIFQNNNNNIQNQNIQNNNIIYNNNNYQNQNNQNTTFLTTITPVIALSQGNSLKFKELKEFPDYIKNNVLDLKNNLKEQESIISDLMRYSKRINDLLTQDEKSIKNVNKFNKTTSQRLNIFENLINKIKDNDNFISESFIEEEKIIKMMEQENKAKIEIPSKFLVEFSRNLLNRSEIFKNKFNDMFTLIKISYFQNNNNYKFDYDIMESTLGEFIKIVKSLLEAKVRQQNAVNEMLQALFKLYSDLGENTDNLYNDIMRYEVEDNEN